MKFVVDTNVIISALIKDSIKRKILIQSGWKFYYPLEAIKEIEKYRNLIIEKAGFSEDNFNIIFNYLTSYLEIIPQENIAENLEEASQIIGKIDADDVIFIASALSVENDGIWSDDEHLKMQNKIKCFNTSDLLNKINSELN